jgi:hypothetical protein
VLVDGCHGSDDLFVKGVGDSAHTYRHNIKIFSHKRRKVGAGHLAMHAMQLQQHENISPRLLCMQLKDCSDKLVESDT